MESRILLTVEPDLEAVFSGLLGFGFVVEAQTGRRLKDFLLEDMGLDAAYIEDRIQTIFLDGKAVDNIDTSIIKNSSSIALSAAMPGLVGATLRRKSHYAAMRGPISHANEPAVSPGTAGRVTVKLFNLIAKELGKKLLERGVWLNSDDFKRFVGTLDTAHAGKIKAAQINDQPVDPAELFQTGFQEEKIFVQVQTD